MMGNNNDLSLPFASRRSFLSLSAAASAALALRIMTEPMLARARVHNFPKDAIRIDANENPLGPSASAREAATAIVPQGGRYSDYLTDDLVKTLGEMEGLKPEQVRVYAGSSEPLHHTVAAFASPQQKETMLQQAGFQVHTVTTDRQREHLQALPQGRVSIVQHNGKIFYAFPDAAHNQIYTGNQAQFQAFKQAQLQASRQSSGLNVNPDPHGIRINEFDGWGPGPLAPTDGY